MVKRIDGLARNGQREDRKQRRPRMKFRLRKVLVSPEDRGPLRVMFVNTSLPVGGAETLLVNLIRRFDRSVIAPELVCLKELGPLGETLAGEIPTFQHFIRRKTDVAVLWRLARLFRERRIDAIVTVGAGDKMFWGRLAARWAGVPVVCSALHSTGWPDGVGRLNRLLTPLTDAFIGVATAHGQHLVRQEGFPREKVFVIPNGVDTQRFSPQPAVSAKVRSELGWEDGAPLVGIVAALRTEKNHELFLEVAQRVIQAIPDCRFVIVGDGPRRAALEEYAGRLELQSAVKFLGTRSDTPRLLAGLDLFLLTSDNEASPVSILEALSSQVPVVATDVGSVRETVVPEETGLLAQAGDADGLAQAVIRLLVNPAVRESMGRAGRMAVQQHSSLERMVTGYEQLLVTLYRHKCQPAWSPMRQPLNRRSVVSDEPLSKPEP